jgi:iron complex transport system permease protein
MQTLFQNPLAGPFVLGINSGASLGVALVMMAAGTTGASFLVAGGITGNIGVVLAASAGSALVMAMVLVAARRISSNIMFGYAVNALVSVLIHFSFAERVQAYLAWSFGSFSTSSAGDLAVMAPVILAGLAFSFPMAKQLNALVLGESYAASMGVEIKVLRPVAIVIAATLAGTVTAFCGPVAFLGIAVPHLARNVIRTGDHRFLIPGCMLSGAIMALAADIAVNLPGSGTALPLNAVTSLIGAPVVIWIIARYQHVSG